MKIIFVITRVNNNIVGPASARAPNINKTTAVQTNNLADW
jgi:hypothetical protein